MKTRHAKYLVLAVWMTACAGDGGTPRNNGGEGGEGGEGGSSGAGGTGAKGGAGGTGAKGGSGGSGGSSGSGGAGGSSGSGGAGGSSGSGGAGGSSGSGGAGGSSGAGGSGGAGGTPDGGAPDASSDTGGGPGGPLAIEVDHVVDMMRMRLCFKPSATNSGGPGGMGGDKSPKIDWTGIPAEAKSLILTTEDLSNTPTVHQIICNMPVTYMGHPADAKGMVPMGAEAGYGHNKSGWYGPGAGAPLRNYEIKIWAMAIDKFPMPCTGTGTGPREAMRALKAMANDKTKVLATASKVLWGQASGVGCP